VALADGDNELVIDLDNVLSIEALVDQVRGRATAVVVELFPPPTEMCASGPEGRFVHELAVPFVRGGRPVEPPVSQRPLASTIPRRFPPGSEWLYLKLYGGTAGADLVVDHVGREVEAAVSAGLAERWFFLRYNDPDPHLRVRVQGDPGSLHSAVRPQLEARAAELVERGELWRVQLDTYEREVERYGGDAGIALAERVFAADSRAALAVVSALPGDAGADLRWRAALAGVDLLFDDLGCTLDEKRAIARAARDGYRREFGVGRAFQAQVGKRFRVERTQLERLIGPDSEAPAGLRTATKALKARSAHLAGIGEALRDLAGGGSLTATPADIAMSYAHMHVNRVLRAAQRAQELVLYEYLDRLYTATAARRPASPP